MERTTNLLIERAIVGLSAPEVAYLCGRHKLGWFTNRLTLDAVSRPDIKCPG